MTSTKPDLSHSEGGGEVICVRDTRNEVFDVSRNGDEVSEPTRLADQDFKRSPTVEQRDD